MKHAKKMMLVDVPSEQYNVNNSAYTGKLNSDFIENYLKPRTAFNLEQDLTNTLNRSDLDDREKWAQYNQLFQRFLFFLNEGRNKNTFAPKNNFFNPSAKKFNAIKNLVVTKNDNVIDRLPINRGFRPAPVPGLQGFDQMYFEPNNYEDQALGHFDMNERQILKRPQSESVASDSFKSMLDDSYAKPLPNSDDENDGDKEDDEDHDEVTYEHNRRRGEKRAKNETPGIYYKKRSRKEKKPIYSYLPGPPLQRVGLEVKSLINKARASRLVNELNKNKSNDRDMNWESSGIEATPQRKKLTVNLDRLPQSLSEQKIRELIEKNKTLRKNLHLIKKWDRLPKNNDK